MTDIKIYIFFAIFCIGQIHHQGFLVPFKSRIIIFLYLLILLYQYVLYYYIYYFNIRLWQVQEKPDDGFNRSEI